MKKVTQIKGYKGFNSDLKCLNKQYALNSEFREDAANVCENGMHFCENPLDILFYYPAGNSRFAEVTGMGKISTKENDDDTKVSCTELKIGAEISLHGIIDSGIKFIFERATKTKIKHNTTNKKQSSNSGDRGAASNSGNSGAASNSGDSGAASNSGDRGAASNSGYMGAASNSGDRGAASNSGNRGAAFTIGSYSSAETNAEKSIAIAVGYENKAKGNIGSWLVLAERNDDFEILDVRSVRVDGIDILEHTFYCLKNGKITLS